MTSELKKKLVDLEKRVADLEEILEHELTRFKIRRGNGKGK